MEKTMDYNLAFFQEVFREFSASTVRKIPGVWIVDSHRPGPVIGLTVMTHGNEPSGLAMYHYFRHIYGLDKKLQRGVVYFILNNVKAAEQYLRAATRGDDEAKRRAQFVDINMNRLPSRALARSHDRRYEIRRARELRPIWGKLEYALDIHSTTESTRPMIIALARSGIKAISRFPIKTVITNIDAVQAGRPACYFYGKERAVVYAIETGGHELKSSFRCAITCGKTFLALLGLIPRGKLAKRKGQVKYRVFDSVWFPNGSYELARKLKNFQPIPKGTILARGDKKPIVAETNCYALMPPRTKKPATVTEEVLFLAHKA